ncbi:MAG: alanine racemase [Actinomycetes bacterium]
MAEIRGRISSAGGDPEAIAIVAVTKTFGPEVVAAALAAGLPQVGENYAQELISKAESLTVQPIWHYLGAVQRRKVKTLAPWVAWMDGVARKEELDAIAHKMPEVKVLLEVNHSEDPARGGCEPQKLGELVEYGLGLGLAIAGLMTVAPQGELLARRAFAATRQLADDFTLGVISMGMTDDLEWAVAEGSTMLRVGRALFGAR